MFQILGDRTSFANYTMTAHGTHKLRTDQFVFANGTVLGNSNYLFIIHLG